MVQKLFMLQTHAAQALPAPDFSDLTSNLTGTPPHGDGSDNTVRPAAMPHCHTALEQ
jgi:hypothetical protein